jgi:hypothetical protein
MGRASFTTTLIGALALCAVPLAARAQDGLRTLSEESYLNPQSWFHPAACPADSRGGLYLSVGPSTLRVPVATVRGIIPGKVSGLTKGADGKTTVQVPRNLGCRQAPLSITSVYLNEEKGKHGALILSQTPPGRELEVQLAKLRDSGSCPKMDEGLIACEGTRPNPRGGSERIAYLMATDPKLVQLSGGPLRARCLFPQGKAVCMAVDDLAGEVRYEAVIAEAPTVATITALHKEARAYIESIRVRTR